MGALSGPSRLTIHLIRWYQRAISPGRAASCRYLPTCSDYGAQAIDHYGLVRGGAKTAWRLLRCHPFSAGGYDPPFSEATPDATAEAAPPAGESLVFHVKQPGASS